MSSEHMELQGDERPEEIKGSQLQPSPETELIPRVIPLQSGPVWLLWTLELGETGWKLHRSPS